MSLLLQQPPPEEIKFQKTLLLLSHDGLLIVPKPFSDARNFSKNIGSPHYRQLSSLYGRISELLRRFKESKA